MQKAPISTELIWNSSGLSLYPHIRQGMCGFYTVIYGCGDAFFKQKEPQSCKPRLKIFIEFGTQLKTLRKSAFMPQILW